MGMVDWWKNMNLKALLAVFIIVGIAVLLLRTKGGMSYAMGAVEFLRVRAGNFVSGLGGQGQWAEDGSEFGISMVTEKASFAGQAYDIAGTTLSAAGLAEGTLKIGDVELHKEGSATDVELAGAEGKFEYTVAGTVSFDGTAARATVDGNVYTSSADRLKVSFEIVPVRFYLAEFSERKIVIESAIGSIARMSQEGSIKSTEQLASEKIEISKFSGSLELAGPDINLQGQVSAVRGTGATSTFSW